jgi:hypothetical protein
MCCKDSRNFFAINPLGDVSKLMVCAYSRLGSVLLKVSKDRARQASGMFCSGSTVKPESERVTDTLAAREKLQLAIYFVLHTTFATSPG